MNKAQEDIIADMQVAWVDKKYDAAFRNDCIRLIKAGNEWELETMPVQRVSSRTSPFQP